MSAPIETGEIAFDAALAAARKFLDLIVFVDDGVVEPFPAASTTVTPGIGVLVTDVPVEVVPRTDDDSPIDYEAVSRAAQNQNLLCSLVRPKLDDKYDPFRVARLLLKADVIVLDWRIKGWDDGAYTTHVIKEIERLNPGLRPQTICVYSNLENPAPALAQLAKDLEISDENISGNSIVTEHLIVRWHRKTAVESPVRTSADSFPYTSADRLAEVLVLDFAKRHDGLVPIIALETLAEVRSNTRPILDRYSREADQGFVFECALLGSHEAVVNNLAECIVDDLYGAVSIAGDASKVLPRDVFKQWFQAHIVDASKLKVPEKVGTNLSGDSKLDWIVSLATGQKDFENTKDNFSSYTATFKSLAEAFGPSGDGVDDINTFASSRYVHFSTLLTMQFYPANTDFPLRQGAVLSDKSGGYHLCLIPDCDSVRVKEARKFPFLKLDAYCAEKNLGSPIPLLSGDPNLQFCDAKFDKLELVSFLPSPGREVVLSRNGEYVEHVVSNSGDTNRATGRQFKFVGQLRPSHRYRALGQLANNGSRIGVTEGELGRLFGVGKLKKEKK